MRERPYLFTYLSYAQKRNGYYKQLGALPYVQRAMEAFDGEVFSYCNASQDEDKSYTRFVLSFPASQQLP